ncbi:MAG: hypothetical protein N2Z23_09260 [Pyrinomonadaceae bacterium]|nr:hypothetical protein [Pyrinomonadaceae bacterium]MCX7640610.1 hypothetical protein [Pyrinomonadaceae bacterium]MDW8305162.1 hypothetical protein [Acidobacteriota bacterium]
MKKSLFFALFVLTISGLSLWYIASLNTKAQVQNEEVNQADVITIPAATFAGSGFGPIPEPTSGGCGNYTAQPRDVTFNVSGLAGSVIGVAVQFYASHTWLGDLRVVLIAPGGSPSHIIFSQTGATTATGCGDSSDLSVANLYRFTDGGGSPNWWTTAFNIGATVPMPAGAYQATQPAPQTASSFSPTTSINAAFTGVTNPNGTWTLRFLDGAAGDTGQVTGATLDILVADPRGASRPCFDFTGTGRTDFATVHPVSTQLVWRILQNPGGSTFLAGYGYGLQSDVLTPGYFVGTPNAADLGVWRPSNQTYYFQAVSPSIGPLNPVPWGTASSDIVGLEADYDGDGIDDPTVVKIVGGNYQWNILRSSNNTLLVTTFGSSSTDVPIAGADYDGDGRADLTVIRGGNTYVVGESFTGTLILTQVWGNAATDYFVVGDYIGDNRADFVVWRGFGTSADGRWYIRENGGATTIISVPFGIPNVPGQQNAKDFDQPLCGDYDGNGKSDVAIYRPTTDTFYWLTNPTNILTLQQQSMPPAPRDFAIPRLRAY